MVLKYFEEINYVRGVAILAVISIHVSAYFTRMDTITNLTIFYITIDTVSKFAVPAFIFVTGFVLYNKYKADINTKIFYEKRFYSIIPQYITISTFYLIASYLLGEAADWNFLSIISKYATGRAFFHLWFFRLIIEIYIICPYAIKLYNYCKLKEKTNLLLMAALLASGIYPYIHTGKMAPLLIFINYLFYLFCGMYILENRHLIDKVASKKYLILQSVIIFAGTLQGINMYTKSYFQQSFLHFPAIVSNILNPLYNIVFILEILYIVRWISNNYKMNILEKIGSQSFAIYLLHAIVLYVMVEKNPLMIFDWNSILFYPVTLVLTLVLTLFLIHIIKKIPFNTYLIGITR